MRRLRKWGKQRMEQSYKLLDDVWREFKPVCDFVEVKIYDPIMAGKTF